MTAALDDRHRHRLNRIDLVVPDGQPVRWALNWLHRVGLRERVYGPELTLRLCAAAAANDLPVYFYGSNDAVVADLRRRLQQRFPSLVIASAETGHFRSLNPAESEELATRIRSSGAALTFIGLGEHAQGFVAVTFVIQLDVRRGHGFLRVYRRAADKYAGRSPPPCTAMCAPLT
jgi:exopolysaccharide biosynthesis WecB/TagA/CpsF family protein